MKSNKKPWVILVIVVAVVGLWGWAMSGPGRPHLNTDVTPAPAPPATAEAATPSATPTADALMKPDKQQVVLVTKRGKIVIDLFPNAAPHHVAQIKRLVAAHYYDGLLFHRVIPGFM